MFEPVKPAGRHKRPDSAGGFTLTELAVVMAIITLLIGGMIMPLSAQRDGQAANETQKKLAEIQEALLGFAIANGRLPCPALANLKTGTDAAAGLEGTTGTGSALLCTYVVGVLPWATLGVAETDSWNNRYSYRVTQEFARGATGQTSFTGTGCPPAANPQSAAFALCSQGDLTVKTAASASTLAGNSPAVVISHGKNGNGAYTSLGTQLPIGTDADEQDNQLTGAAGTTMANANFISNTPTATFDDIVTWVSPNVLFNRMIAAGKLP